MASDQALAKDRLRRALLAFQSAKTFFLNAHRRSLIRSQSEVTDYWAGPGREVKTDLRIAAAKVEAAFQEFAAAGLVGDGLDRPLIAEARRYFAEGKS